jgi:hypothetical protein
VARELEVTQKNERGPSGPLCHSGGKSVCQPPRRCWLRPQRCSASNTLSAAKPCHQPGSVIHVVCGNCCSSPTPSCRPRLLQPPTSWPSVRANVGAQPACTSKASSGETTWRAISRTSRG